MSLFRTYSPRRLWMSTLQLVNAMFHTRPSFASMPKSYFKAVIHAHQCIRSDLDEVIPREQEDNHSQTEDNHSQTTIEHVHASLQDLEKRLFGCQTDYPATIEGCCQHTELLQQRLGKTSSCVVV